MHIDQPDNAKRSVSMGVLQRKRVADHGGKRVEVDRIPATNLVVIGVDTEDGPEHPLWQPDAVRLARTGAYDDQTVRSMQTHGVIQPIVIYWREIDGILKPVVETGRKRVLHAREAARRMVDSGALKSESDFLVMCREWSEVDASITMAENLRRRDPSPVELGQYALSLRRYLDDEAVAAELNVSKPQVGKLCAIASGSEELREAVYNGLTISKAARIATLPEDQQREVLLDIDLGADLKTVEDRVALARGREKPIRLPGKKTRIAAFQRAEDNELTPREWELMSLLAQQKELEQLEDPVLRRLFALDASEEYDDAADTEQFDGSDE
jgi:hypothetical protein